MGESERPGWTCFLCVGGSEGHRLDLFLVYDSREGHSVLRPFSCAQDRKRGIDGPFLSCYIGWEERHG